MQESEGGKIEDRDQDDEADAGDNLDGCCSGDLHVVHCDAKHFLTVCDRLVHVCVHSSEHVDESENWNTR
jgi:hypothetical protein